MRSKVRSAIFRARYVNTRAELESGGPSQALQDRVDALEANAVMHQRRLDTLRRENADLRRDPEAGVLVDKLLEACHAAKLYADVRYLTELRDRLQPPQ